MSDPERYVSVEDLQEELPFAEAAFDVGDWDGLLRRLLDEESERIEGDDYTGREWASADDVPAPVRHAIIRLVRSRLDQIKTDGVDSESMGDGSSYSYRPPESVLAAVQATVRKFRDDDDATGFMVI